MQPIPQINEDQVTSTSEEFTPRCNQWTDLKKLFKLSDDRYEEFEYLLYLDLKNPFVINYANYHLGIEKPIFKNRLSYHYKFWEKIGAPNWIVDIMKNGV